MLVLNKRRLIVIGLITALVLALTAGVPAAVTAFSQKPQYTFVIDAGHGGIDGGVKGLATGVLERDLNLAIAKKLADYFKSAGFGVVMTRKDENGLYDSALKNNFKRADMERRAQIIKEASANAVISIHMNSFPRIRARRGSQVFYNPQNDASKLLGKCIQDTLNQNINEKYSGRNYIPLSGDLFILRCSQTPSVIVECGFLSNPLDEQLLLNERFQTEIAYHIFSGALSYLAEASLPAPDSGSQ
jgi:N-acetylmuramoyl-L-alanine amidase